MLYCTSVPFFASNLFECDLGSVIYNSNRGRQSSIRAQLGFHYLEVPLAGMGAAGESHGQACAWGLHWLNPVSYGMSSVTQTSSELQEDDNKMRFIYEALQNVKTELLTPYL